MKFSTVSTAVVSLSLLALSLPASGRIDSASHQLGRRHQHSALAARSYHQSTGLRFVKTRRHFVRELSNGVTAGNLSERHGGDDEDDSGDSEGQDDQDDASQGGDDSQDDSNNDGDDEQQDPESQDDEDDSEGSQGRGGQSQDDGQDDSDNQDNSDDSGSQDDSEDQSQDDGSQDDGSQDVEDPASNNGDVSFGGQGRKGHRHGRRPHRQDQGQDDESDEEDGSDDGSDDEETDDGSDDSEGGSDDSEDGADDSEDGSDESDDESGNDDESDDTSVDESGDDETESAAKSKSTGGDAVIDGATGTATFFTQDGTQGACQLGQGVLSDSDLLVAMCPDQFQGACGQSITVTNHLTGQTATGTVNDECPECECDHIDLSVGFWDALGSPQSVGVIPTSFSVGGEGGSGSGTKTNSADDESAGDDEEDN